MASKRARKNYIALRKDTWERNQYTVAKINLTRDGINEQYRKNAARLRGNMGLQGSESEVNKIIKDMKTLLSFKTESKNDVEIELAKFGQEISEFVGDTVKNTMATDSLTMGQLSSKLVAKGVNSYAPAAEELATLLKGLSSIRDEVSRLDATLGSLAKDSGLTGEVSFLKADSVKSGQEAYRKLNDFILKYTKMKQISPAMGPAFKEEMNSLFGSLMGSLKGELLEYTEYMYTSALAELSKTVNEEIMKIEGATHTGPLDTFIKDGSAFGGQTQFVSKSDNIVKISFGPKEARVVIDVGISDKSYAKENAVGRSVANGVSWDATFQSAGLRDQTFEWYYANLMRHEFDSVSKSSNIYNKYLAAAASSFLISGVENGSMAQAYFVRYADGIYFVPDLLEEIASNRKNAIFKLSPADKGSKEAQEYIGTKRDWNQAYSRAINTLNSYRRHVKFNVDR